jgi:integrase
MIKGASVERYDERPILTLEQVRQLADAIAPRYRAMVLVAVWTGLRYGEAAALCRRNISLDPGTIRVERQLQELSDSTTLFGPPKTAAGTRTVAIPPHVVIEIAAHLDRYVLDSQDAFVFTSAEGALLRRSNFNRRVWRPACSELGLSEFRFHDLRHTGNTLAASTGASTKELMVRIPMIPYICSGVFVHV